MAWQQRDADLERYTDGFTPGKVQSAVSPDPNDPIACT